jgi:hypothetical protein
MCVDMYVNLFEMCEREHTTVYVCLCSMSICMFVRVLYASTVQYKKCIVLYSTCVRNVSMFVYEPASVGTW